MITSDLVSYIQSQIKKNISKDLIILHLSENGWRREDIDEGFLKVASISDLNYSSPNSEIKDKWLNDPYRESPSLETNPIVNPIELKYEAPKKIEEQKAWVPIEAKPISQIKTETSIKVEEPKKITPGSFIYSVPEIKTEISNEVENQKSWVPNEVKPATTPIPEVKIETPAKVEESKIWTPMNIKAVTSSIPEVKIETPKEEMKLNEIEILPEQISPIVVPEIKNKPSSFETFPNEIPVIKQEPLSGPVLSAISFNQPKKSFSDFKTNTSDTSSITSDLSTDKNLSAEKPIIQVPIKIFHNTNPISSIPKIETKINTESNNKPESAIISSFRQDIDSVTIAKNGNTNKVNKNSKGIFKILAIVFMILLVAGGVVFAFINSYIKMPISIIKNDPKVILLNTSSNFSKLKSYKTNTEITLSSPSFANITSGLVNGEAVVSNDRDYISFNTNGLVNKNDSQSSIFDYNTTIKGSFLKNNITTDIKYADSKSYIKMPDLSEIIENYTPTQVAVLIPSEQLNLITSEFPPYFKDKINKIGVFDILSNIMSNSFGDKFSSSFNELVNSSTMAEKPNESINGQDSYHYEIIVDRQNTKKFLVSLMNTYANNNSPEVKSILEENLGSTILDSFEIWISKADSNILQYKFKLSAPLSKIIGLDDKGIADNTVSLDWKTTYSDFDVANEIIIPTDYIKIEDYLKDVHNNKIKSTLSSFGSNAKNLFNAEGSFGKRVNKTGSCTAPDSGSLFSPLGHDKGASTAIASISSSMNDLLALTEGPNTCFSTLKAWSVSSSLVGDQQSFFCVDSNGASNILTVQPIGTTCVVPIIKPSTTNPVNMPVIKPATLPVVTPSTQPTIPAINPAPTI